jgi:ribosomal protein L21E
MSESCQPHDFKTAKFLRYIEGDRMHMWFVPVTQERRPEQCYTGRVCMVCGAIEGKQGAKVIGPLELI